MKKIITCILAVAMFALMFTGCSVSSPSANEHRHSYAPGSELCANCGEAIVICSSCQMVCGAEDEECYFCHSELS